MQKAKTKKQTYSIKYVFRETYFPSQSLRSKDFPTNFSVISSRHTASSSALTIRTPLLSGIPERGIVTFPDDTT